MSSLEASRRIQQNINYTTTTTTTTNTNDNNTNNNNIYDAHNNGSSICT